MLNRSSWIEKCQYWKEKWNTYHILENDDDDGINFYSIIETLNSNLCKNDIVITDAGTAFYIVGQALKVVDGARLVVPGAQADMGFALPASVGVGLANENYNPIVVTGDGSFQTNIQELATIKANNIKTKFIILNNYGYLSIRNTQSKYYNNNVYGSTTETGLWFPDLCDIARSYNLEYCKIEKNSEMFESFAKLLHSDKCIIFDIRCKFSQEVIPSVALKPMPDNSFKQCGLDDMAPFLTDEEYNIETKIS